MIRVSNAILITMLAVAEVAAQNAGVGPAIRTAAVVGTGRGVAAAPILGYLADPLDSGRFTPMMGVAGSTFRSSGLELAPGASASAISPSQDYALVAERDSGLVSRISLKGAPAARSAAGTLGHVDRIAISPAGLSALLYSSRSGYAEIVTGLTETPQGSGSLDLSSLSGRISAIAINDVGDTVLAAVSGETTALFALTESSAPALVYRAQGISSVAFVRNSRDAILALPAENRVVWLRDVTGSAAALTIADAQAGVDSPVAAVPSDDGGQVFALNASGRLLAIPLSGTAPTAVFCGCKPTGMQHLRGGDVFLLTAVPGAAMKILDGAALRIHAVPGETNQ